MSLGFISLRLKLLRKLVTTYSRARGRGISRGRGRGCRGRSRDVGRSSDLIRGDDDNKDEGYFDKNECYTMKKEKEINPALPRKEKKKLC